MKKFLFILFFSSAFFGIYNLFFIQESKFIEKSTVDICGDFPINFVKPEIGNNSNYVFDNDSSYEAKRLLDIEGNIIFVNSFIECEHYVSGGWNFVPNPEFIENSNSIDTNKCEATQSLRGLITDNDKVYIKDINFKSFLYNNSFKCIGKISNLTMDNNSTVFEIFYSHQSYLFFSQLVPLALLLIAKLIKKNVLISMFIFYQIFVQYVFNYNFGLNVINSISFFNTLIFVLFINEVKSEVAKRN